MADLSYQLYSSRSKPLGDTLRMLSALGYRQVEGYGGLFAGLGDPGELKAALDANGLAMTTAHFGLDMVEGDPMGVVRVARTIGIGRIFVPAVPREDRVQDAEGWAELGRRLALSA